MGQNITKISLQIEDKTVTWEKTTIDSDVAELLEAFRGLLVAQTFVDKCVVENMAAYTDELS